MAKVYTDEGNVVIPPWVVDLRTFRRWAESDEFPEEGRIAFVNGEVYLDMSKQQAFSHVRIKDILTRVIGNLVRDLGLGEYFGDGLRVTNVEAEVSNVPDGTFVSMESFRNGRVQWAGARENRFTEQEGSPDLLIEVVSDSSEDKDTEWLMTAYWNAGVEEYWIVDARSEPLRFDIFKRGTKGFSGTRKSAGWLKSHTLGKSFRFRTAKNPLGHPDFTLDVRG